MEVGLLFDAKRKPSPVLSRLLLYTHSDLSLSHNELIQAANTAWLRPHQHERWHLQENNKDRDYLLSLFDQLGMVQEINPSKTQYDYIVMLGGDLPGMQTRFEYLDALWQKEIRADTIILLGSDRPLDADHEKAVITTQCTTEFDLLKELFMASQTYANLGTTLVGAINALCPEGHHRATTHDSYIEWLSHNPTPGSCLFISSQPHIGYQDAVAQTTFKPPFKIETVGPQATADTPTAEYFDTLARWMYQYRI